jgi:hypothetical protein
MTLYSVAVQLKVGVHYTYVFLGEGSNSQWWNSIKVHPYALETAYQYLKHFVYVYYGCGKQSEVDVSLNYHAMASFQLHK